MTPAYTMTVLRYFSLFSTVKNLIKIQTFRRQRSKSSPNRQLLPTLFWLKRTSLPCLLSINMHICVFVCVCVCTHDSVECSVGGPIKAMTGRWLKTERASWSRWWQKIAMTEGGVTRKAGNGAFEKSMRAAPGKAAERDLCLCVSSVGR